ncbi:MAG: DUF1993 domain-containing protein [Pseudomonadota bacterium]
MNLYDQSVATYRSRLNTLSGLLTKAAEHTDGDALLQAHLAEDMLPLAAQIRFLSNIPGEALSRLGACAFISDDDELTSFAEAQARVTQMTELLDGCTAADLPSPETRVEFSIGDGAYNFEISAEEYVREFSLPNFYFHLTIVYAILRMKGLEIGKADFIPHMMRYFKAPAS